MKYIAILCCCLYTLHAGAQTDVFPAIQTRVNTWQSVVLQEKLFVHTDKPFYLSGEICWCRVYCVDGNTHRPQDISKLAYIEFLDQDNKSVLQGKIALDKGLGEGSFYIPPGINTGVYRLRAYTNWMKNFGPQTFFESPVTIVNTIKGVDTATLTRPDSLTQYSLRFFPEGGDLVTGLPSTVAFEALNTNSGQPLDAGGAILGANNDTILSFHTQTEGLGTFTFTPVPGQTYKAILRCPDNSTRTFLIPGILPRGYTIHLLDNGGDLTLVVHASRDLALQDARLFIHSGTWSAFTDQPPTRTGDSATFIISRRQLQDGNSRFTLFDFAGRPQAERLFFLPPHKKLAITTTTDKQEYATREKLQLDISAADTSAHLSVAVYRLDSLQGEPVTDIVRYLWTSSEWTGRIPGNRVFDDPSLANLYTLTHGWSRFLWSDVLTHPTGPHLFPPEIRGQLISGRLTDPHSGAPVNDVTTWLSTPGLTFQFAATQTDTTGKFQFDIKDFYGQDGIIIHTATEGSPYKVEAFTPFSEQYARTEPLPAFRLRPTQLQTLTRHNIGMQVENIYTGDSLRRFRTPRVDTTPFFNRSDYTYLLDNYTRFTSIEEVLREYVREINITRKQGHQHIVMLNEPAHTVFTDDNTLVLLDGVPVPNDRIFNYDPLKVKKLDVIPREYILGPSHFSGIASFTTFKGDFEGLELDPNSLQLEYEGMQYHREFYSPAYNTNRQTQSRLPDFRNVLYWSPDVRAGTKPASIGLYTSDLPGEYLVVVQGLSADGRAGISYTRFTVRPGSTAAR